jgi:hypothetical protein
MEPPPEADRQEPTARRLQPSQGATSAVIFLRLILKIF